jgi:hypothetical protein
VKTQPNLTSRVRARPSLFLPLTHFPQFSG